MSLDKSPGDRQSKSNAAFMGDKGSPLTRVKGSRANLISMRFHANAGIGRWDLIPSPEPSPRIVTCGVTCGVNGRVGGIAGR